MPGHHLHLISCPETLKCTSLASCCHMATWLLIIWFLLADSQNIEIVSASLSVHICKNIYWLHHYMHLCIDTYMNIQFMNIMYNCVLYSDINCIVICLVIWWNTDTYRHKRTEVSCKWNWQIENTIHLHSSKATMFVEVGEYQICSADLHVHPVIAVTKYSVQNCFLRHFL